MKTSKPMQLRILDKMRENVESGEDLYNGIEIFAPNNSWYGIDEINYKIFKDYDVRIKPETITINGVEIPKPLSEDDMEEIRRVDGLVYQPVIGAYWNARFYARSVKLGYYPILFRTEEQAIEASKLLFGIED